MSRRRKALLTVRGVRSCRCVAPEREERTADIQNIYCTIKHVVCERLGEFRRLWETGSEEDVFAELVFCILTPQSRAKSCWAALKILSEKNLLLKGNAGQIAREINIVRFKNKKAEYVVAARRRFSTRGRLRVKSTIAELGDPGASRRWLVKNVKGLGMKEASHFLRNIGLGEHLAILDRHILKNLKSLGIIGKIPVNLSGRRYEAIEKRMQKFAREVSILMSQLDFVLWYKETGEVFK
jgi:N-glycosylase/DNA lyase